MFNQGLNWADSKTQQNQRLLQAWPIASKEILLILRLHRLPEPHVSAAN